MKIRPLPLGPYETNCYLVDCGDGIGVIVDPGDECERIVSVLNELRLTPAAILLTHGHLDHISAVPDLLTVYPNLPVRISNADLEWCFSGKNRLPGYREVLQKPATAESIADGDVLSFGSVRMQVLATPGHSPGSVCFLAQDTADSGDDRPEVLFSGDTLFAGSIGRVDFYGGDERAMGNSLRRLAALSPATVVLPGHGCDSTLRRECRTNPYLQFSHMA